MKKCKNIFLQRQEIMSAHLSKINVDWTYLEHYVYAQICVSHNNSKFELDQIRGYNEHSLQFDFLLYCCDLGIQSSLKLVWKCKAKSRLLSCKDLNNIYTEHISIWILISIMYDAEFGSASIISLQCRPKSHTKKDAVQDFIQDHVHFSNSHTL